MSFAVKNRIIQPQIIAILIATVVLAMSCSSKSNQSKAAILPIYYAFETGKNMHEISELCSVYGQNKLRVSHGDAENGWSYLLIKTPTQIGAQNWILIVEFENGKASAARIRTLDSLRIKPKDAPPDIIGSKNSRGDSKFGIFTN